MIISVEGANRPNRRLFAYAIYYEFYFILTEST